MLISDPCATSTWEVATSVGGAPSPAVSRQRRGWIARVDPLAGRGQRGGARPGHAARGPEDGCWPGWAPNRQIGHCAGHREKAHRRTGFATAGEPGSERASDQWNNGRRTGTGKGTRTSAGRQDDGTLYAAPSGGSFAAGAGRLQTKGPVIGSGHEATGQRATRGQTVAVRSRGVPYGGHARALAKHTVDTEQQQERTRHPWLNSRSISFPAFPTTTAS